MRPLLTLLLVLSGCPKPPTPAPRTFAVLAINDTYRIEGLVEADEGGMSRVRSLREALSAQYPDLIVTHAGDLLSPSLLGRKYKGEQMIEVLNHLDGDGAAQDNHLFVIFGNHEFDKDKLEDATFLDSMVDKSQFHWLNSNVRFNAGADGQPLVAAPHLTERALVESGGVKVGLFSATIDSKKAAYIAGYDDPLTVARAETAALRAEGAEVVIAITHLDMAQDRALLSTMGADGPDVILGGHDHARQCAVEGGRSVYKADADARTATVLRVTVGADGQISTDHRYAFLGGQPSDSAKVACPTAPLDLVVDRDPAVETVVQDWLTRFDAAWCADKVGAPAGCLEEVLGKTNTAFEAEEERVRQYETSAGDWVADQMRAAFAKEGAQIAFVNAGSLRLNQDLPAGALLRRRHMEELIGFPDAIKLVRLDGATLQQVVNRAVQEWTGSGHWLQVSGFAWRHDPSAGTATSLTLLTPEGARPVRPDETLLAAVPNFLVTPSMGQDGYTMLKADNIVATGPDLKQLLMDTVVAAGDAGITPTREGRICNTLEPGPCLAISP